jgi:hypothetical protein
MMLFTNASLLLIVFVNLTSGFQVATRRNSGGSSCSIPFTFRHGYYNHRSNSYHIEQRLQSQRDNNNSNGIDDDPIIPLASFSQQQRAEETMTEAATNTINERLMTELVEPKTREKMVNDPACPNLSWAA